MNESADEPVLFHEPGTSWRWLLLGPLAGVMMYAIQITGAASRGIMLPIGTALVVTFFLALQIYAARLHTSVRLTPVTLQQGGEGLPVSQIRWMYPDADRDIWEEARPLGEMSTVPKGRKEIGLRLTGGRRVRAWARRPAELREQLAKLVPEPPAGLESTDIQEEEQ